MVGEIGGCNPLEPIQEAGDKTIRPSAQLIQESVSLDTGADANPQESMSESSVVQVT